MSERASSGFSMPPEWAPHRRCWMAWPCRAEAWGQHLEAARRAYAEVAQVIAQFEPVTMIARPELTAQASLYCGTGISTLPMPQDDSWVRDTGPTFLIGADGALAGVDWRFNGWGEVWPDYDDDAEMARRILDHAAATRIETELVCEGGAVHVDGEGTCLVCTPSILDPKRNPGVSQDEAERELRRCLGCDHVIWLPAGLADDETSGHVDNLACFARPGVVLAMATEDRADANYSALAENLDVLHSATDARDRKLEIVTLPQPKARARHDGRRLTQSYINLYIANGGVVMPSFDDGADTTAFRTIAATFPDRKVIQVDAQAIVQGGGGIHCITQQQPDPRRESDS